MFRGGEATVKIVLRPVWKRIYNKGKNLQMEQILSFQEAYSFLLG